MTAFWAHIPRRRRWTAASVMLALLLHGLPLWISLLRPAAHTPNTLELELAEAHSLRERVFRELAQELEALRMAPVADIPAIDTPLERHTRLSSTRSAEDMDRARVVQRAIRVLWEDMHCATAGYAVVRLRILQDGRIGDYAVTRLRGQGEFRAFLMNFLQALQGAYGQEAGPGEELMLECEFMVVGKTGSRS